MATQEKGEKLSFADVRDIKLKEALERSKTTSHGTPPPSKERTLIDVWEDTNVLLERIACALEGRVKDPTKTSPPTIKKVEKKIVDIARVVTRDDTKQLQEGEESQDKEIDVKVDTKPQPPENIYIREVRSQFMDDINELLDITDEGEFIKIKTRGYIGTEVYAKVKAVVKDYGGVKVAGVKEKGKWYHIHIFESTKEIWSRKYDNTNN